MIGDNNGCVNGFCLEFLLDAHGQSPHERAVIIEVDEHKFLQIVSDSFRRHCNE